MKNNQYHSICNENSRILRNGFYTKNGKDILLPARSIPQLWSEDNTKRLGSDKEHPFSNTKIYCSDEGTVDFVLRMKAEGVDMSKVGVLHFVNAVPFGMQHSYLMDNQEGDLLRCSDLSRVFNGELHTVFYGDDKDYFHSLNLGFFVTSDTTIFRDSEYKLLDEPITVHCVSTVPFNHQDFKDKNLGIRMFSDNLLKDRMFYALCLFYEFGCTHIGLGALGCGEGGVHPTWSAFRWRELLTFMKDHFAEIVMPVPECKNSFNYKIFDLEFNK